MFITPLPDDPAAAQARLAELQAQIAELERHPQDLATKLQVRALRRELASLAAARRVALSPTELEWEVNAQSLLTESQYRLLRRRILFQMSLVTGWAILVSGAILSEGHRPTLALVLMFLLIASIWAGVFFTCTRVYWGNPKLRYCKGRLTKLGPWWLQRNNVWLDDKFLNAPRPLFEQLQSKVWYEVYYTSANRYIVSFRPIEPEKH